MSPFQLLQPKRSLLSTPTASTSNLLPPSRPVVPISAPAPEPTPPAPQAELERTARLGHHFTPIPLFPPDPRAVEAGKAEQAGASATMQQVATTSASAQPERPSHPASPNTQASLDRTTRLGYSFARIPLFPPEKKNTTGLPDALKVGVETFSGLSMDDVHVHYNSSKPAQVRALAYTQGTEIHVGPGQEQHLAHEAWHVAQQKQGRVMPTMQTKGMAVNDDQELECEADVMGARAQGRQVPIPPKARLPQQTPCLGHLQPVVQRVLNLSQQQSQQLNAQTVAFKYANGINMTDQEVLDLINEVLQRPNITTLDEAREALRFEIRNRNARKRTAPDQQL